ncbi:MAG TPA: hypothetical protein VMU40_05130 [Steroidobacteraceae bacterium]|nr:hypothetical protein [Steroidobacteraceae bacterium]
MRVSYLIVTAAAMRLSVACADSIPCPAAPPSIGDVHHDVKADVEAAIGKLGPLRTGELTAKTEVVTKDLVSKYPNADRVHIVEMMAATYCAMLRDAKDVPDKEKLKLWTDFVRGAYAYESGSPPSLTKQSPHLPKPKARVANSASDSPPHISRATPAVAAPAPVPAQTPTLQPESRVADTNQAPMLTGAVKWSPDFVLSVSGAGNHARIYGWYIEGKSPSFTKLQDAFIISKLTGHEEKLAAYDIVWQRVGSLDEIETVPPNANIHLGLDFPGGLSPQQFMDQWGQMEVVVTYNDDQKYVVDYSEAFVRQRIATVVIGAFGPEITRKKSPH